MSRKSKDQLRNTADSLAQERATRTPQQQLMLLDNRFGKDQGAQKERTRLLSLIHMENKTETHRVKETEQLVEIEAKPAKKKRRIDKRTKTDIIHEFEQE